MKVQIAVEGISKRFVIDAQHRDTRLTERLASLMRSPFRGLGSSREEFWALRDVSFEVGEGEVVGIIGRNGAGKSTLLKILSKITYPTTGRFRVNGRIAALLEVGTGFHEELTGRENVFLNGSILGMKRREVEAKLDQIVEFAGVERFIDTPIKRYSSGMRLRLGFAVAAHLEPDVLIVDEILAVGDAGFQKKCLAAMDGLRNVGRTVLFVSHNMAAVENLCHRGIWIEGGRVQEDGAARAVIHSYMATFADTQRAGTDLMNVKGRRGSGEIRLTGIEFMNVAGQPQLVTRSGDSIVIRLRYAATSVVKQVSIGMRLSTDLGTLITDTSTWHHGLELPDIEPGTGYLDLCIDSVNLLPGSYTISLAITGANAHFFDGMDHCARLEIETANIYNSGRILDNRYGIVFFPQHWRMNGRRL
jgi:lipopolysaccharide transport system ATP-binding protein